MIITGIADEAGDHVDTQIAATKTLGWQHIEARFVQVDAFEKGSIHEIPEEAFDLAAAAFHAAEIQVCSIGSTIGNWAHSIKDPFDITEAEIQRCIKRMHKLGAKIVRYMSYAILEEGKENDLADQLFDERIRRCREIITQFEAEGITPVHENCMNYGGMSISHAIQMQEAIPDMKWVFDTGNPVFNPDRSKPRPYPRQSAWEFYKALKAHIAHVHIKDGHWNDASSECTFTMPGEGQGDVERILADLSKSGYKGFISIEPHVATVFHDTTETDDNPEEKAREQFESYVEYGRRLALLMKPQS
ncbi:MAG: sugar phosphate isomerase/epimerase [Verrucomicrobiaceae bacterium]|nr:sugar phosphate isomerase/epimerase [Verrucomicrobiaceae bacterium]